jgi:chromosome segregation ATPase
MIKRIILGVGGATLLGAFFLGRDAVSYVSTSLGCIKDSVHNSVPIEFQLQRARQMLKDLVPEVQKHMHVIAQGEVDLQRLEDQVAETEVKLAKEKDQITQLNTALGSGKDSLRFGARKYTVEQVKLDLAQRFERYKTNDATLTNLRQIHSAREHGLDAARQKLEGMLAAKRQLQVEVENLEARNQMVAAAQTTSKYSFDDSELGRIKELIADLRTRLDVSERLVNAEGYYHDEIPLEQAAPADIGQRVTKYFTEHDAPAASEKLAEK